MSKICRTFAPELETIMKKMYNKPQIDVTVVNTANMLMDITVSTNSGGGGGGTAHAPASGDVID